jgi:hypothetical protein
MLSSDKFELQHSMVVAGLVAGKEYHFRVGSTDTSGNGPSYSNDSSFTTMLVKDPTPPAIQSTRVVSTGQDNVTLEVVLSEPGTFVVDFGEGRAYGKTAGVSQFRTTQRLTITGLEPGKTYHYRVVAQDASGNDPTVGGDQTFKTRAAATKPGSFALTTESMPIVFLAIVVLAVALTLGIYLAGKRGGLRIAPSDSGPQYLPPEPSAETPPPESPRVPEAPKQAPPMMPPPSMTVIKKVDVSQLEDEDTQDEVLQDKPATTQEAHSQADQRYGEGEILKMLSSLPRGLPSTLWGMEMEELAGEVSRAERSISSEGDLLIKLRGKWYFGDPKDIGNFLQLYKKK